MSFAHANGINISYEVDGKGFPVIFIHGFGSKKEIWKPQIIDFKKEFTTVIFDLRGTGKTDRPNYPYTMDMFANDIKGLMEHLEINSAHLIGRSFGGMIAQNFILKYPNFVKKLVLIATNAKFDDNEAIDLIVKNQIKGIELKKNDPAKAFWNEARFVYHRKFRQVLKINPKKKFYNVISLEDLIKDSTINPSSAQDLINQGNAMKEHNTFIHLDKIKHDTLLITASHDRLIPKSSMIEIKKRIPNSTLKTIENAGHFMTISKASEVNKIILDFLKN